MFFVEKVNQVGLLIMFVFAVCIAAVWSAAEVVLKIMVMLVTLVGSVAWSIIGGCFWTVITVVFGFLSVVKFGFNAIKS